jgi:hypothetical protein
MRQRWRAWTAAALVVVVIGVVPVALDRDSYPLSTFPMFSADIDRTQAIDTAVGLRADGSVIRLTPAQISGTTIVNQAASVVSSAIGEAQAGSLCDQVAGRLGDELDTEAVAVEVVTEHYDAVGWFDGRRAPVERIVHAHCAVPS